MSLPQSKYPPQTKPRPQRKPRPEPQRVPETKPAAESKSLPQSKVTAQGQISVPAEVRRQLGIIPGTVLEWEVKDNTAVVRRKGKYTFEDMHRILFAGRPVVPHTLEELKQAIGQHLAKKHARR
jgi:antitoxin PrlF